MKPTDKLNQDEAILIIKDQLESRGFKQIEKTDTKIVFKYDWYQISFTFGEQLKVDTNTTGMFSAFSLDFNNSIDLKKALYYIIMHASEKLNWV